MKLPVASTLTALSLCLSLGACQDDALVCDRLQANPANPAGAEYTYLITTLEVPGSAQQASELAMDIDKDGRMDNSMGGLLGAIHNLSDYDLSEEINQMVLDGELLQLLTLKTTSLVNANGTSVQVSLALDTDNDPSDNFTGDEVFAIDSSVAPGMITGFIDDGVLTVELGNAPLAFSFPGLGETFMLPLTAARIEANVTDEGLVGRIGGVVSMKIVRESLVPALAEGFRRAIATDCPDNICTEDSFGQLILEVFDTDDDQNISVAELEASTILKATLLNPDMDLYSGSSDDITPFCDEVEESLSVGFGFTAIRTAAVAQ